MRSSKVSIKATGYLISVPSVFYLVPERYEINSE